MTSIGWQRFDINPDPRYGMDTSALLATIVATSDDAMVSNDLHGMVTTWNPAAERIFGFTAVEAIGEPMTIIVPSERRAEEAVFLGRVQAGERVEHVETVRQRRDGQLIDVSMTLAPVCTTDGAVVGVSTIARDLSAQKRNVSAVRDELLAILSHELRTPLNAILGWADIMLNTNMDESSRSRALGSIQRNARAQAQLIEDLLDVSRIVSGTLAIQREHVDLALVVGAAVEELRPESDTKQITLRTTVASDAGVVTGDPLRLQQVVWNLLSNAIKFTPAGGVVDVILSRVDDNACITVRDTGHGIAPAFLPHVFDRFRQADSSPTRRFSGLGLGLCIVKHLVDVHRGAVTAASDGEGLGAEFTVRLPLRRDEALANEHPRALPPLATVSLAHVRALIVDDDRDAADLLVYALVQYGAHATAVASALEALAEIERDSFNVLLADIGMPAMDGYELIQAIREREHNGRQIPLSAVAITAHAGPGDRERAIAAGFDWHLTKPVDTREVISLVARITMGTAPIRPRPLGPATT